MLTSRYLRSALSSIGTVATDITRRLDYTYYNLLEKLTAVTSSIASFQELATHTADLYADFERETTGLDQEIRRQLGQLDEFQPQIRKIESLETRMKDGKQKAEALGSRLDKMRGEIDGWEKREVEWHARVGRRLRIFWAVVGSAVLVLVVAMVIQSFSSGAVTQTSPSSIQAEALRPDNPDPYPTNLARYTSSLAANPSPTGPDFTHHDPLRLLDEL